MRLRLLASPAVAAFLVAASAVAAPPAPPPVRANVASAPAHAPAMNVAHEAPVTHEAPHPAAPPSTLHLGAAHPATPAPTVSKADPHLVEHVKASWTSRDNDRPYRLALRGESLPAKVGEASQQPGTSVLVVTRGPDRVEKRLVRTGGGLFSETEVKVPSEPLPPEGRLYIVRHLFSATIYDAEGHVVAAGHDQVPGYAADFQHSESTDWSGKPLGGALRLPASAAQKPNPSLPARNPDVRPSGGGSTPYSVPVNGTKTRVFTRDPGSFYAGGEETTDESEWGGRAIVLQPRDGGRYVPPRVVNLKAIVDAKTGEPVTQTLAISIDGQDARYEPRTRGESRPDLTLRQIQAIYAKQLPGPLF